MDLKLVEPLRLPVQGRGPRGRPRARPARGHGLATPVPRPGLAIRVIGEVTAERLEVLRAADAIFIEELRAAGLYGSVSQALAVLTPLRTVGVMGDGRTYAHVVALRAVTTEDFMTADWARLPVRPARPGLEPDRQRGQGDQPGRLRHQHEAARRRSSGSRRIGGR